MGFAHPGLTSGGGLLFWWVTFLVARPFFFPARWGLTPLGSLLFLVVVLRFSVMALRAFRRTVSLDVSQLAGSNDRKTVSTFIVEHFAQHNIHAVQFIGTVAKVTFAVEASKQEVISHQAININGVQCAVRGGGPRAQNVLVYNYPVEGPEDPIRRALGAYGVIEEVKFRHWTHMPTVGDGVRIVRMVRREAIPRHMTIGEVRVKIAYVGQQQVCDLCDAPGHIARNCPFRNKCFRCGLEGHFSRNCPQLANYHDRDSVLDESDPTPAEAAGRSVSAAGAAAAVPSESTDAPPRSDADSLDGATVSSALDASATGTALDADVNLSDSEQTPSVGPTPSSTLDSRDNQLDELVSQSLLSSPAPSGVDVDSLQGATIESAVLDPPASPSSPGQGPPSSASSGFLGKIKQKLNKKKDSKVIDNVNVIDTGNGKVHSSNVKTSTSNGNSTVSDISGNAKTSISGNNISSNAMTYISNGNSNVSSNAKTSSSESEYIGLGVLAGRENNSDMELEVESQKRSHPDSDSVDSVDDSSFAAPLAPPPRSSKKKPAVVVSPGAARPVAVDRDRSRSRSPKRSPSATRSTSTGSHALPPSLGYVPKPPRSSSGSKGSKPR